MSNVHLHKDCLLVLYDLDGNYVSFYETALECANSLNCFYRSVVKCANGIGSSLHGYQMRWVKKENFSKKPISKYKKINKNKNCKVGVLKLDENGNIIKKYASILEAAKETKTCAKSIREVLKGNQKRAGGYYWKLQ